MHDVIWNTVVALALVMALVVIGLINGQLAVRKLNREERDEARAHGYESWAEYMEAEGDPSVRRSWKPEADRERAKRAWKFWRRKK